jgi:hypothetical protein
MKLQHPFRPWQIPLWLILVAIVGGCFWLSWYPSMAESRLRGLDASHVIQRLGNPVYDSRISRQAMLDDGTPASELEPEGDFVFGYYRGIGTYFSIQFNEGRVASVKKSYK